VRSRLFRRVAVVVMTALVPVLAGAAPAMAKIKQDDGEVTGPSLGTGDTLLVFVVIPLGVFLLICALAALPSALSKPRYRPGKPWGRDAAWIGDPMDTAPLAAPPAGTEPTARGGASAEW
jgi:hypothetical protein